MSTLETIENWSVPICRPVDGILPLIEPAWPCESPRVFCNGPRAEPGRPSGWSAVLRAQLRANVVENGRNIILLIKDGDDH